MHKQNLANNPNLLSNKELTGPYSKGLSAYLVQTNWNLTPITHRTYPKIWRGANRCDGYDRTGGFWGHTKLASPKNDILPGQTTG